jgi:hypothetical protein
MHTTIARARAGRAAAAEAQQRFMTANAVLSGDLQ